MRRGFGLEDLHLSEEMVALWASKKVGRPVKWTGDRSEAFLTDAHAATMSRRREMAFDKDNKILGLRVKTTPFWRLHVAVLVGGADLSLRHAAIGAMSSRRSMPR